jgi:hypothetical protein
MLRFRRLSRLRPMSLRRMLLLLLLLLKRKPKQKTMR